MYAAMKPEKSGYKFYTKNDYNLMVLPFFSHVITKSSGALTFIQNESYSFTIK